MELGQRLRQARLEAGLSQRQLCGDAITRNMLSQIENGSATPSMDTLRFLAARLGKPTSYFLDEETVTSPNQPLLTQARAAFWAEDFRLVLELLRSWREPDPVFDPERFALEALACLRLAEQALTEQRPGYAERLLEQAVQAGEKTPYYTAEHGRTRLLLAYQAQPEKAAALVGCLPDNLQELLLRGQATLDAGDPARCGRILDAAVTETPQWHFLRGEAYFRQTAYREALPHYHKAEAELPKQAAQRLEFCYQKLEDYKMAYYYACQLRQL